MDQSHPSAEDNSPKKTGAVSIVDLLVESGVQLFHDQYNDPFISIDGTTERTFGLRTATFKDWLANFVFEKLGKSISAHTQNSITQILSGKALYASDQKTLSLRAALREDGQLLWYDLGNNNTAIIGKGTWTTTEGAPVIFRRLSHQQPQALPDLEANRRDLLRLLDFLNIRTGQDRLLYLAYLVAAYIPGFPHPLLVIHGPQGAGKTTPFMILKSLIDPSQIYGIPAPSKPEDFVHIASKHYFFYFDNLSRIAQWLSDSLARIVTGDGFSKRKLFTDDDDVVKTFQRTIGINGINQVITQSDLLDRAILIGLERISDDQRMEYGEFWRKFDETKPKILGAIFKVISEALEVYPSVKLDKLPRMADFMRWGCAISVALGYTQEQFVTAYYANINRQHDEVVENSPIAQAILSFMEDRQEWIGTPTELFGELAELTPTPLGGKNSRMPQAPNWLVRALNLLQPNLLNRGILYERLDTARPRQVSFRRLKNTVDTDVLSEGDASLDTIAKVFGPVEVIQTGDEHQSNDATSTPTVNRGSPDGH